MFSFDAASTAGDLSKGKQTRERIRVAALRSFRERGYEATTVRLLAQEVGVSVGVTNYHFPSKNHLVQELYLEVMREFRSTTLARLSGVDDLVERLRITFETGIDVLRPFHGFASEFLSAAMSPQSPLNPLSGDSEPALSEALTTFRELMGGASHKLPDDIARMLPDALMMAYLLLALFWSYDISPSQQRTQRLLDRSLRLFALALPLVRMPALRRPIRELLQLVGEVRS